MSTLSLLERYGKGAVAGSRVSALVCRACGHEMPVVATSSCDRCFGPLEVEYDYTEVSRQISRASIAAGPPTIWRYQALLPLDLEDDARVSLGEGLTPLIHARNLGAELGLRNLHLKNDTLNPTGSFKDRVVSVAVSWARRHGIATVACASTGNLANSVAAYAAHAGCRAVILVPADLEPAKILATSIYRPTLIAVDGTYDDVNRLCVELADRVDWGFCNINLRAFYGEGSKTLTFETAEQLGWCLPDEIVVPVASGCQFVKHRKAAGELIDLAHCAESPDTLETITPVRPDTIARSIAIGNPSDGADTVRIARETGGVVEAVSEEEIIEGIELLAASEGIFAETAGGVTVAVLRKLARSGRWSGDETVVAYITGHGLKTADAVSTRLPVPEPVAPSLRAFSERFLN